MSSFLADIANFAYVVKQGGANAIAAVKADPGGAALVVAHVVKQGGKKTVATIKANPGRTVLVVAGGATIIAPMLIAGPLLGMVGFGASGPIAGTLAAFIQSCIGNVAAGSLFAILQSAAMGGAGTVLVGALVQMGVVTILAAHFRQELQNVARFALELRHYMQRPDVLRVLDRIRTEERRRID
ncbi:hypothetical protein BDW22DRAFT_1348114 [Trametopsis cervina]|nr:hypothetical protein BDW22DRAFT_1348114 [Trametopsis cervina]